MKYFTLKLLLLLIRLFAQSSAESPFLKFMAGADQQTFGDLKSPLWQDPIFAVHNFKTISCLKGRLPCDPFCFCPGYHGKKDRRRAFSRQKYFSNPCSNIKIGDEWKDPWLCPNGDQCTKCHTRLEQQFHPEVYKSIMCKDFLEKKSCPKLFCAFAHSAMELPNKRTWGFNLCEFLPNNASSSPGRFLRVENSLTKVNLNLLEIELSQTQKYVPQIEWNCYEKINGCVFRNPLESGISSLVSYSPCVLNDNELHKMDCGVENMIEDECNCRNCTEITEFSTSSDFQRIVKFEMPSADEISSEEEIWLEDDSKKVSVKHIFKARLQKLYSPISSAVSLESISSRSSLNEFEQYPPPMLHSPNKITEKDVNYVTYYNAEIDQNKSKLDSNKMEEESFESSREYKEDYLTFLNLTSPPPGFERLIPRKRLSLLEDEGEPNDEIFVTKYKEKIRQNDCLEDINHFLQEQEESYNQESTLCEIEESTNFLNRSSLINELSSPPPPPGFERLVPQLSQSNTTQDTKVPDEYEEVIVQELYNYLPKPLLHQLKSRLVKDLHRVEDIIVSQSNSSHPKFPCLICRETNLEAAREWVFYPCGHQVTCFKCHVSLRSCPYCGDPINLISHAYDFRMDSESNTINYFDDSLVAES